MLLAALVPACVGSIGDQSDGAGNEPPGSSGGGEPLDVAVGATPLRRLTRVQYEHTIRDLLGLTPPSVAFAPDERVGAFRSNAIAPVTELIVEQYMAAAEELALAASAEADALLPCAVGDVDDACVADFVAELGQRAFRRPLSDAEVEGFTKLYERGAKVDVENGVRLVVQAALQSPFFLYHVESGLEPEGEDLQTTAVRALSDWELASRLSYFLWDSMPDDELFEAAAAGELRDAEGRRAQALRMLEDERARDAIGSFHLQWLRIDELEALEKNTEVFPEFDEALRQAMRAETTRFADYVLRKGDGKLDTLLTAPWSLVEGPLAGLYGVELAADHDPEEPVDLDPEQRSGLLTQASVLAQHAHADQSSPVFRGVVVRESVLCQTLPPPPPDVANVPPEPDPNATTRERFAEHTSNPACASCHSLIDGIGFGFENYDGLGAFRTLENELPVDASGELLGTKDADGKFDGVVELSARLAKSDEVRSCVSKQWFRFAFGRLETKQDQGSVDAALQRFGEADWDVRELVLAIVDTEAFAWRRASGVGDEEGK